MSKWQEKKQNLDPMWKILMKEVDNYRDLFESWMSAGGVKKLLCSEESEANISSWSFDTEGHAKKCAE